MPFRILLLTIFGFAVVISARGRGGYGRSHSYPSSHGLSGNTVQHTSGSNYNKPSNTHTYPGSTGLSGNHQRTSQTGGLGNSYKTSYKQQTEVHNHYYYSPPSHISYGSQHYPVFAGTPPSYVYVYKDSGSRYDNLLTGLALYNLGRMSNNHHDRNIHQYSGNRGDICKLGISKVSGEYEETRIDCKLMSSFIWDAEREKTISSSVTKTVNVQVTNDNTSSVVIQNTTVVEALEVKGASVSVTPGMKCFMIRTSRDSSVLKKNVECSVLQEYAAQSLRYSHYSDRSTQMNPPISIICCVIFYTFVIHLKGGLEIST